MHDIFCLFEIFYKGIGTLDRPTNSFTLMYIVVGLFWCVLGHFSSRKHHLILKMTIVFFLLYLTLSVSSYPESRLITPLVSSYIFIYSVTYEVGKTSSPNTVYLPTFFDSVKRLSSLSSLVLSITNDIRLVLCGNIPNRVK